MSFQYFNIFCESLLLLLGTCINVRGNRRLKYCLLQTQYSHSYVQDSLALLDIEVGGGLKAQDLLTLLVVEDPCYKCILLKLLFGVGIALGCNQLCWLGKQLIRLFYHVSLFF